MQTKLKEKQWWNNQLERVMEEKKKAEVKKEVTKLKNEAWEHKCAEIERLLGSTRFNEVCKTLKNQRKNEKQTVLPIRLDTLKAYYEKLLNEDREEYKEINYKLLNAENDNQYGRNQEST
ncbi:hypothetical protein ILUMI_20165 [Ignelater luminosus]|uniref:Uncharacterized protein n=1 Tax=Ignelater luminosus TaxID=2038154 RepID=A0A8K0CGV7_IGNLU|nr:hypothetical protein ILUMI_20165 [Ignelater luminosus]